MKVNKIFTSSGSIMRFCDIVMPADWLWLCNVMYRLVTLYRSYSMFVCPTSSGNESFHGRGDEIVLLDILENARSPLAW